MLFDYFAAVNDARVNDAAACFASDALVHDESHDHLGHEAVLAWISDTTQKYQPRIDVTLFTEADGSFVATGMVSGTFPGSPIRLQYAFTVQQGKITRLVIQ